MLFAVAGVGYLTFLAPPLHSALSLYTGVLATLAELALLLWLLVRGVNAERWKEQASVVGVPLRS